MEVVVIGGGAAGFFAALSAKAHRPGARVVLLEKSDKLLSKVRISGGGRCNVCPACFEPRRLATNYPRGERFLRKSFTLFSARDTVEWFNTRGVALKAEEDGRMFPVSNDSSTIVDALLDEAEALGVDVRTRAAVAGCVPMAGGGFRVRLAGGQELAADRVIITTGGHTKPQAYEWISALGHPIVPPVPSLFTFNMPNEPIRALMGVVADPVRLRVIGTDLESYGPLLITHWGMSGPAVLRISAWGARILEAMAYQATVQVNWLGGLNEDAVRDQLAVRHAELGRKQAGNANPFALPRRLWVHLLQKANIDPQLSWSELSRRERNRLIDLLTNDRYSLQGKTTFKEEFVTAGGVDLEGVDPVTLESRMVPGLHFAGEVLDIDGITGGFNFEAAWTTGVLAGRHEAASRTKRDARRSPPCITTAMYRPAGTVRRCSLRRPSSWCSSNRRPVASYRVNSAGRAISGRSTTRTPSAIHIWAVQVGRSATEAVGPQMALTHAGLSMYGLRLPCRANTALLRSTSLALTGSCACQAMSRLSHQGRNSPLSSTGAGQAGA